ncbi:MAG: hypothetical protein ACI959_000146 [Limisphaerales bacterium]|jgi:hypothetical protein
MLYLKLMKYQLLFLVLAMVFLLPESSAQSSIDGTFAFDTDPAKKYSLYIPSDYDENEPHRIMMGFHPFNTARWDAESWRDTLIVFAETNGLILACPDGGADGAVDDPIDTAFTSALMDSIYKWYNIDEEKVYAMGFSVGGKTTYTYALSRPAKFKGLIPIGAAINNLAEVNATLQANSSEKPVYIVHGSADAASVRFYPVRDALLAAGAILNDTLMPGVGHTIDFVNRNSILSMAFQWIDSVNCFEEVVEPPNGLQTPHSWTFELNTNLIKAGTAIQLHLSGEFAAELELVLSSTSGIQRVLNAKPGFNSFQTSELAAGLYFISAREGGYGLTKPVTIY